MTAWCGWILTACSLHSGLRAALERPLLAACHPASPFTPPPPTHPPHTHTHPPPQMPAGDVTMNVNARCIVMTTEILRSMIYRGSEFLR